MPNRRNQLLTPYFWYIKAGELVTPDRDLVTCFILDIFQLAVGYRFNWNSRYSIQQIEEIKSMLPIATLIETLE